MAENCGFLLPLPLKLHHALNQNLISYHLSYQSLPQLQAGETHLLIFPFPSQILFEARLWHHAYKNDAAGRLLRKAHNWKHHIALSSFSSRPFSPLSAHEQEKAGADFNCTAPRIWVQGWDCRSEVLLSIWYSVCQELTHAISKDSPWAPRKKSDGERRKLACVSIGK